MKKRSNAAVDSPDRLNVIVEGSKIIGDFNAESNVRIDGEVEGNVSSSHKVVIGQTGRIKGNLTCGEADIEGNLEGILKVESLLSLRATATITGDILTAKIQIEEGAKFSGSCKMNNYSSDTTVDVTPSQQGVVY